MGKRIPDLADGVAWSTSDEIEISRAGASSLRLSLVAARAGLFPASGGTITGNVVVTGDVTVNAGTLRANQGFRVTGDAEFDGEIHFINTTAPGLILNNLTTAERDALTVFGGEVIYNTSTNNVDFFNGATWEPLAASGNFVSKAGDTMTGLLGFTGTDHPGLRLNILTTAQKNALTPGAADFLYDSTLSRPFYWDGFGWQTFVKTTGDAMTGTLVVTEISHAGGNIIIKPDEVDGSLPFGFNSSVTHTSNYLFILANNNVPVVSVTYDGGLIGAAGATFSGVVQAVAFSHATALNLTPGIADGSTPYAFDTTLAHTSGDLLTVENNGVVKASIDFSGAATLSNLRLAQSTLTYAATTDIDLAGDAVKSLSLTGNVTFTTSNRAANRSVTLKILCDGSDRTFTFPSWIFVGEMPAGIAANKTGILTLTAFGSNDTDIVAAYAVQS